MCVKFSKKPTCSKEAKGWVTISFKLRSSTPKEVIVTCTPPAPGRVASKSVLVDGFVPVEIEVDVGVDSGIRLIDVKIDDPGCSPLKDACSVPL